MLLTQIHTFFINWTKKFSRKGIYKYLESQLCLISQGGGVLNIGAGGNIEKKIRLILTHNNCSTNIVSIDTDPKRNPDLVCNAGELSFTDNFFDMVCLMEVLEHIQNPQQAINEIFRVLKPGGLLIYSVPFVFPLHDRPEDYFRFTKYGLKLLLHKYNQIEIIERNSFFEAIEVLIMRLIMEKGYRPKIFAMLFMLSGTTLLSRLLNYIIKSDTLTTGYLGSAKKP